MGYAENLGSCSSMTVEIQAVLRGLKIAKDLLIAKLWVQLDSKVLVDMLQGNAAWSPFHKFLLKQCTELLSWNGWEVKVTHCFREANQTADRLANLEVTLDLGVQMFQSPPTEVTEVFKADCIGAAWPRSNIS